MITAWLVSPAAPYDEAAALLLTNLKTTLTLQIEPLPPPSHPRSNLRAHNATSTMAAQTHSASEGSLIPSPRRSDLPTPGLPDFTPRSSRPLFSSLSPSPFLRFALSLLLPALPFGAVFRSPLPLSPLPPRHFSRGKMPSPLARLLRPLLLLLLPPPKPPASLSEAPASSPS